MAKPIKIAITTGDPDGIGPEVTVNALCALGKLKNHQFIVFCSAGAALPGVSKLKKKFKVVECHSIAEALWNSNSAQILVVPSSQSAAHWVELAANLCLDGQINGMVTAPLSKTLILKAGFKDIGHTEILARVSKRTNLFMGFVGSKFSVVLATGHIPLAQIGNTLTPKLLKDAVQAAIQLRSALTKPNQTRPIALVGLNPHAGESGLLGNQESWFKSLVASSSAIPLVGPLVPDAAFLPDNWKKYSVFVCPYHDQGLIPFKLVHGFKEGVHITLGLPFVRTSVDHGTAKDLVGKKKSQHGSMLHAIKVAIQLIKEQSQ